MYCNVHVPPSINYIYHCSGCRSPFWLHYQKVAGCSTYVLSIIICQNKPASFVSGAMVFFISAQFVLSGGRGVVSLSLSSGGKIIIKLKIKIHFVFSFYVDRSVGCTQWSNWKENGCIKKLKGGKLSCVKSVPFSPTIGKFSNFF